MIGRRREPLSIRAGWRGRPFSTFAFLVLAFPNAISQSSAAQSGCVTASVFAHRSVMNQTSASTYSFRALELRPHLSLTFEQGEAYHVAVVCKAGDCARLPFTKVFMPEPDQVFHNEDFRWVYFQIYFVSDSESSVVNFKQLTDELIVEDLSWERAELFCK